MTALWTSSIIDTMDVMGVGIGDIDRDGRPDVVAGRNWYRNTGSGWIRYAFTTLRTAGTYSGADFSNYSYLSLRDLNGDGRLDIFATLFAESPEGKVYTFVAPADPTTQPWTAVQVDAGPLFAVHTQQAIDFDASGRHQVLVGESNFGGWDFGPNPDPQIYLYRLVGNPALPGAWERSLVDTMGTHEGKVADLDRDGLPDFAGHSENTDFPVPGQNGPVYWWENRTAAVAGSAPVNQAPPAVSGAARIGSTLAGSNGSWGNGPGSYTYEWQRCHADGTGCVAIAGGVRVDVQPDARRPALHAPVQGRRDQLLRVDAGDLGGYRSCAARPGADSRLRVLQATDLRGDGDVRRLRVAVHRRRRRQRRRTHRSHLRCDGDGIALVREPVLDVARDHLGQVRLRQHDRAARPQR